MQNRIHLSSNSENRPKWFNSPVSFYNGILSEIGCYVPEFERRAFGLTTPGENRTRINQRLDMIVRQPIEKDPNYVPVGVVSKEYVLVSHTEVLNTAIKTLESAHIEKSDVKAELNITEYGERMSLSLYLPEKFSFDPGDGYPLSLRLELFNSVDGSTRFRALMGWFRFVCSNGMVIGVTRTDVRLRHIGNICLSDIGSVLSSGIAESENEKRNFKKWRMREVKPHQLLHWVEEGLRKDLGFKAAARLYHISQTGYDADIVGPYKNNSPRTIPVQKTNRVPGTPEKSHNLYDLSQILAWLAKERRDLHEQLEWREKIPALLKPLMN